MKAKRILGLLVVLLILTGFMGGLFMQERVSEGTSIKDFCQNRGISKTTYFYWQRKLHEAAAARMIMETGKTPQGIVPSGWSQAIAVSDPNQGANGLTIEVGVCRLRVEPDTDPALLIKVCRALKSLC